MQIVVVPACLLAFGTDSRLCEFVVLEQVERDVPQHPEVLCGVAGAYPAFVFPESDIQHPVQQRVLYALS